MKKEQIEIIIQVLKNEYKDNEDYITDIKGEEKRFYQRYNKEIKEIIKELK